MFNYCWVRKERLGCKGVRIGLRRDTRRGRTEISSAKGFCKGPQSRTNGEVNRTKKRPPKALGAHRLRRFKNLKVKRKNNAIAGRPQVAEKRAG